MTELAPNAPASAADRFAEFKFGRIPIGKVSPVIEHGAYPAKAVEGEALPISARIYREGHDAVGATAVLTSPSGEQTRLDMNQIWPQGLDIWQAWVRLDEVGDWTFRVEAWGDDWRTWHHNADIKLRAAIDTELVRLEGHDLFTAAAQAAADAGDHDAAAVINRANDSFDASADPAQLHEVAMDQALGETMKKYGRRRLVTPTVDYPIQVDRKRALYGS